MYTITSSSQRSRSQRARDDANERVKQEICNGKEPVKEEEYWTVRSEASSDIEVNPAPLQVSFHPVLSIDHQ